ncbi:hypothetical protein NKH33_26775 [Mesorhizobium sp. M1182]|uniref:hypothetical protein n=1 Tax=Mesorhizobium sp. M1182 TaxID=2957067 RepID=UPI003336D910
MEEPEIRARLTPFLDSNPKTELKAINSRGKTLLAIVSPWGDPSIALEIPNDPEDLIDALLNIALPERLSAIYHRDTKSLEVVWTAFKLGPFTTDVFGRQFEYVFGGKSYICNFGSASERLLAIASVFFSIGPPDMGYRNLASFRRFCDASLEERNDGSLFGSPSSFWIRDIELSEDDLVSFVLNLNFYMSYYDDASPRVIVHAPQLSKGPDAAPRVRYRLSGFPQNILGRPIDLEILQFWEACQGDDPARRFLYAFRIIEHAAFSYVESMPKQAVRKVLMTPHALDDIFDATERVIAAVRSSNVNDYQKFEHIMVQTVDPSVLWPIIEGNIAAFSGPMKFDGGFELKPFVADKTSKAEFINSGLQNFCGVVRKIRNALSHGREDRNAVVITPTRHNYEKLRPWATLMVRAAGEVILYERA